MVKLQLRGPRHGEGRRPPQRQRRGDAHLRVSYASSHTAQRVNLGSLRLPATDDEAAAFLQHCQDVMVEVGVGGGELASALTKIGIRLHAESGKEEAHLAMLRQRRDEQRGRR